MTENARRRGKKRGSERETEVREARNRVVCLQNRRIQGSAYGGCSVALLLRGKFLRHRCQPGGDGSFGLRAGYAADCWRVLILVPRLDVDVFEIERTEGGDKTACQAAVGNEWDVEIDGGPTNFITVGQLAWC